MLLTSIKINVFFTNLLLSFNSEFSFSYYLLFMDLLSIFPFSFMYPNMKRLISYLVETNSLLSIYPPLLEDGSCKTCQEFGGTQQNYSQNDKVHFSSCFRCPYLQFYPCTVKKIMKICIFMQSLNFSHHLRSSAEDFLVYAKSRQLQ